MSEHKPSSSKQELDRAETPIEIDPDDADVFVEDIEPEIIIEEPDEGSRAEILLAELAHGKTENVADIGSAVVQNPDAFDVMFDSIYEKDPYEAIQTDPPAPPAPESEEDEETFYQQFEDED